MPIKKNSLCALSILFVLCEARAVDKKCDSEALSRLATRSACQQSNTVFACQKLAIYEGTAAGIALMGATAKNPEVKMVKEYLKAANALGDRMKNDYRALLEAYYELKKASPTPKSFENPGLDVVEDESLKDIFSEEMKKKLSVPMDSMDSELSRREFERFRDELTKNPKLKNNLMLAAYANGDVAQNYTQHYYKDPKIYEKAGIKLPNIPAEVIGELHYNIGFPRAQINALALQSTYAATSKAQGYPGNKVSGRRPPGLLAEIKSNLKEKTQKLLDAKLNTGGRLNSTAVLTALGFAGNLGLSVVENASRQSAVISCAKDMGVQLSEEDSIKLSKNVHLKKGLSGQSKGCENISLSAGGVEQFLISGEEVAPSTMKFLCGLEEKLAVAQDTPVKEKMEQAIEANASCDSSKVFPTNLGKISVNTRGDFSWDYTSFKSTDPKARSLITDKLRSPMAIQSTMPQNLNPSVLCDGRQTNNSEAQALCELSEQMNTSAQTFVVQRAACAMPSAKTKGATDPASAGLR